MSTVFPRSESMKAPTIMLLDSLTDHITFIQKVIHEVNAVNIYSFCNGEMQLECIGEEVFKIMQTIQALYYGILDWDAVSDRLKPMVSSDTMPNLCQIMLDNLKVIKEIFSQP